jgi:hypothetical protein
MTHCSDDDLVLHHYGESPEAGAHVAGCPSCALRARELAMFLTTLPDDGPERGEHYGLEVFHRVRPHLEARHPWWAALARPAVRWATAATAVVVIGAAGFVAGRFSIVPSNTPVTTTARETAAGDAQMERRVLLLSVADHLERSDRVLTDIMNTPGSADISAEQQWASDLVAANRLFRQDALDAEEASVADVLDELERTLLDIVHRPADTTPADLDGLRRRIDSAALLFKVRVMTNELRQQQLAPDASKHSSTPIS